MSFASYFLIFAHFSVQNLIHYRTCASCDISFFVYVTWRALFVYHKIRTLSKWHVGCVQILFSDKIIACTQNMLILSDEIRYICQKNKSVRLKATHNGFKNLNWTDFLAVTRILMKFHRPPNLNPIYFIF